MSVLPHEQHLSQAQIAVAVKNVGMTFGQVEAVKNASFTLNKGKFLTILGPSGSGKTTFPRTKEPLAWCSKGLPFSLT
jgi:ABC-type branched-subunit amino acid transport system ATPase component